MPVTSVNIAAPYWFDISGGPITTSGTITIGLNVGLPPLQVLASPVDGTGPLELRPLTAGDLPIVSATPGSYTNADITIDQYGRVIDASSGSGGGSPAGTVTSITVTEPLTGGEITSVGTIGLGTSGVTPGSYSAPSITVDSYGRITSAANGTGIGTVTSVTSANGNATVANPTTTPVITIVSAPKWLTARNLAGNSVDGSANVAFSNKFIVQGTTDSGLSGAQFLGALATGIVKNTTTTGVLSIASAGTDYEVPLTFSTGLTRTTNTITVNTSQNISILSNLTTNGFVKTTGGTGTLSIDTNTYITGNQTITLSGDVSGSGTTAITTAIGASKVTNSMLAGSIAASKLIGTDITTTGTVTVGTWNSRVNPRRDTLTTSSSYTPDIDSYDGTTITALASGLTINAPTGTPVPLQIYIIRIKDNGTSRALSWNAIYRQGTTLLLPSATTISKTLYCEFIYNSTDTKFDLVGTCDGF